MFCKINNVLYDLGSNVVWLRMALVKTSLTESLSMNCILKESKHKNEGHMNFVHTL